jgi:hypothetical protein
MEMATLRGTAISYYDGGKKKFMRCRIVQVHLALQSIAYSTLLQQLLHGSDVISPMIRHRWLESKAAMPIVSGTRFR